MASTSESYSTRQLKREDRAGADQPGRRRPCGQRPPGRRLDRPRARPAPTSSASPSWSLTGYPPEDLVLKPSFVRDNLAAARRGDARRPRASRRSSGSSTRTATSSTPPRSCTTASSRRSTTRSSSRTTASSTSSATSSPATAARSSSSTVCGSASRFAKTAGIPSGPMAWEAHHGARAADQHQRLALPRRQACPARGDDRAGAPPTTAPSSPGSTRSAGRMSSSSTATASSSVRTGEVLAHARLVRRGAPRLRHRT